MNWRNVDFTKYVETELAKQGLKLTDEGKAFYNIFCMCTQFKVPDHFISS